MPLNCQGLFKMQRGDVLLLNLSQITCVVSLWEIREIQGNVKHALRATFVTF